MKYVHNLEPGDDSILPYLVECFLEDLSSNQQPTTAQILTQEMLLTFIFACSIYQPSLSLISLRILLSHKTKEKCDKWIQTYTFEISIVWLKSKVHGVRNKPLEPIRKGPELKIISLYSEFPKKDKIIDYLD